jgi:hypothetical protein
LLIGLALRKLAGKYLQQGDMSEMSAALDELNPHEEIGDRKLLSKAMGKVQSRMADFKEHAKANYSAVLMSRHQCQDCGGSLKMRGLRLC